MSTTHDKDELGAFLRRHDPALPQSPDRLALLQSQIMQQARAYEQETQAMIVHVSHGTPLWQRLGMPAGACATLFLGVMVGLNTQTVTQDTTAPVMQAAMASTAQAQTTQEGFLLSPWQNWIKEEPK